MSNAIENRRDELHGILGDMAVREKELWAELDSIAEAKAAIRRELYLLGQRERSLPLFSMAGR